MNEQNTTNNELSCSDNEHIEAEAATATKKGTSGPQEDDRPEFYLDGQEDTSQPADTDLELERVMMSRRYKTPRTPVASPVSLDAEGLNARAEEDREKAVASCSTPKDSTKGHKPRPQGGIHSDEDRRRRNLSPGDHVREFLVIPYSNSSTNGERSKQQEVLSIPNSMPPPTTPQPRKKSAAGRETDLIDLTTDGTYSDAVSVKDEQRSTRSSSRRACKTPTKVANEVDPGH